MARPGLLFIAPLLPAAQGVGTSIRGWNFIEAYAQTHDVHLLVVPVINDGGGRSDVASLTRSVQVLEYDRLTARMALVMSGTLGQALPSLCCYPVLTAWSAVANLMEDVRIDVVHVQRLYMAPVIRPLFDRADRPFLILDLDDDEARTFDRVGDLHTLRGEDAEAQAAHAEARKFEALADGVLSRFDRVVTCSQLDADRLSNRYPAACFSVVKNTAPAAPGTDQAWDGERDIDLLFVGTFWYIANRDGAEWFAAQVLPLLPETTRVWFVGHCSDALKSALTFNGRVTVTGWVDSVAPYYARSKVAIAPIRAGGGTRIKILEAVSHGVPVVSTTLGAEGLALPSPAALQLADNPADFAQACRTLLQDQAAAQAQARHALAKMEGIGGRGQVLHDIRMLALSFRLK